MIVGAKTLAGASGRTSSVAAEVAESVPPALVAVTTTTIVAPTSAETRS